MNPPLISIILPAFNAEQTIGKTIASVLAQTYAHFELLVINDGSSDQTAKTVASIPDPRITMFSYANAGQAASRNRGLKQVKGDYVAFIDADDCWTPDKLAAQLTALQTNPEAALAYSWVDYVDPQGHLLHPGCHVAVSGDVYAKLLLSNFLESGSNPLICRWALAAVGEFDATLSNADDWDMWLRLASRYPFVCVKAPQILYRVSPASVSANISGLEQSTHLILERNFSQAATELQALKPISLSNLYLYFLFRTLETAPSRRSSLQAIRHLGLALKYNPGLLQQRTRLTLIALAKLVLSLVLSPQVARTQFRRAKPTS